MIRVSVFFYFKNWFKNMKTITKIPIIKGIKLINILKNLI